MYSCRYKEHIVVWVQKSKTVVKIPKIFQRGLNPGIIYCYLQYWNIFSCFCLFHFMLFVVSVIGSFAFLFWRIMFYGCLSSGSLSCSSSCSFSPSCLLVCLFFSISSVPVLLLAYFWVFSLLFLLLLFYYILLCNNTSPVNALSYLGIPDITIFMYVPCNKNVKFQTPWQVICT